MLIQNQRITKLFTMKILAIDTSTEACSAALYCDGENISRHQLAPRKHGELLLPMLDELLAESGFTVQQMDAVAFGRGPGSFTGLRIAAGVIQGLAFAADLPVAPVSTLTALAQGIWRETGVVKVLPALDARLQEVYWSACHLGENQLMSAVIEESVCAAKDVYVPEGEGWQGGGSGWDTYSDVLNERLDGRCGQWLPGYLPHASDIALLAVAAVARGDVVPAEQALPIYLRDNVASKPAEVKK